MSSMGDIGSERVKIMYVFWPPLVLTFSLIWVGPVSKFFKSSRNESFNAISECLGWILLRLSGIDDLFILILHLLDLDHPLQSLCCP
jgi:hypothetical protein